METQRNVTHEMLVARGYTDIAPDGGERLSCVDLHGNPVFVFFTDIEKFNTDCVQFFAKTAHALNTNHCIIVYHLSMTAAAKKLIRCIPVLKGVVTHNTKNEYIQFEMFTYKELSLNITKHSLQPKFECLPPLESAAFKKKWGGNFPKMNTTDPVAKFYNFPSGTVVKTTRGSGYVTYRIVKRPAKAL